MVNLRRLFGTLIVFKHGLPPVIVIAATPIISGITLVTLTLSE